MHFENQEPESRFPPYSKRWKAAVTVLTGSPPNACGIVNGPRDVGTTAYLVGTLRLKWANLATMLKTPAQKRQDTLENLRTTREAMMSAVWHIAFEGKPQKVRHEATLKIQHVQHSILALEAAQPRDVRDPLVEISGQRGLIRSGL